MNSCMHACKPSKILSGQMTFISWDKSYSQDAILKAYMHHVRTRNTETPIKTCSNLV